MTAVGQSVSGQISSVTSSSANPEGSLGATAPAETESGNNAKTTFETLGASAPSAQESGNACLGATAPSVKESGNSSTGQPAAEFQHGTPTAGTPVSLGPATATATESGNVHKRQSTVRTPPNTEIDKEQTT